MSTGHLQVRLLGPFEVLVDGRTAGPSGERRRGLLALLALDANTAVPVDALVDRMWGEDAPASAVNVVQTYVSAWRKALDRDGTQPGPRRRLETVGAGYRLNLDADESDVLTFRDLLARGRLAAAEERPSEAADLLGRAIALWRGPALADLSVRDALTRDLDVARLDATESWATACLRSGGDVAEVARVVAGARAREPLRETLTGLLMWALAGSGRQAEALQVFDETRRLLRDELGADPGPGLTAMHQRVLAGDDGLQPAPPTVARSGRTRREAVPAAAAVPTPIDAFHGRSRDLAVVADLLGRRRLVTLTGPGGAGKTRLATEILARERAGGRTGWLVELAPLIDTDLVASTVAVALGVHPAAGADPLDSLVAHLGATGALLVLDNLEHLRGVHRLVDRLHRSTPHLRILVTSREPLRIDGEQQYPVQPLAVPAASEPSDVKTLAGFDAVRLLMDRVQAHDPSFALDSENAAAIAEMTRRLDGLPLALEIAAPWIRLLTPSGLLDRLTAPLDVAGRGIDVPDRHRSLRDTISWSYDLLPEVERALLRALATFVGTFTLEAVERVVVRAGVLGQAQAADALFNLVDRNLVQAVDPVAGQRRFRLLETIRSFAAAEAARQSASDIATLALSHAEWYAGWSALLAAHSEGPDSRDWLALAVAEADNLRAAMTTFRRAGRTDDWLQLAVDAMTLWFEAGHEQEGEEHLSAALEAAGPLAPARAIGLTYWAWLRVTHSRAEAAQAAADAVALSRAAGDSLVEAFALQTLGESLDDPDDSEAASRAVFEAADRSTGRTVRYGPTAPDAVRCGASYNLAARWLHRSVPQALAWQEEALRRAELEGDRRITAVNAARLALVHLLGGETERAHALLDRARELVSSMVTARWEDIVTYAEGQLALYEDRPDDAELLLQRVFRAASSAGRPLHTNLGGAALADLYTVTDRPREGFAVLDEAARAATGAADRTHVARLSVRRARLQRLVGRADEAHRGLAAWQPDRNRDALSPERVIWLLESAWLAAETGQPSRALAFIDELAAAKDATGVHLAPWELRWRAALDDLLETTG